MKNSVSRLRIRQYLKSRLGLGFYKNDLGTLADLMFYNSQPLILKMFFDQLHLYSHSKDSTYDEQVVELPG